MKKLEKINKLNQFKIFSIKDREFEEFGKIIENYDFKELQNLVEIETTVPETGNIYLGSWEKAEKLKIFNHIKGVIYGGMDIQIGYCNGNNTKLNGLEYHKGSELNVAVTDLVLFLGNVKDIKNGEIKSEDIRAFYVEKGEAIELYQTTMHFAPCKLSEDGFKAIVILPKDTNSDIDLRSVEIRTEEDKYLFKKNKWLLVHEDRQDLIEKGAHKGIIGKNLEVKY